MLHPETLKALNPYPKALRTHLPRLLGPKTMLHRAFGAILSLRVKALDKLEAK